MATRIEGSTEKRGSFSRDAKRSVWSVERAGKAKALKYATGVHLSEPYRRLQGKPSPALRAHEYVAQLSNANNTDATPFIVSLKVTAMKPELRKWEDNALVREWWRLFDLETDAEAREERASRGNDWDEFCRAHLEEASVQERLVAVTEILVYEREINPRMYSKDGHRNIRPVS